MEAFYEWVSNITFYLIFVTVVIGLLPAKEYEKYFKLFAGIVLILLVVKPFTSGLRLEEQLSYYFESISFQKEAGELKEALSGMEQQRLDQMIAQYEKAVETDLKSMAESENFRCRSAEAVIEGDMKAEGFGKVKSVWMAVSTGLYGEDGSSVLNSGGILNSDGGGLGNGDGSGSETVDPVRRVETVEVKLGGRDSAGADAFVGGNPAGADASAGGDSAGADAPAGGNPAGADSMATGGSGISMRSRKTGSLRRRIAEYYDLEEQDIEIQLEDE